MPATCAQALDIEPTTAPDRRIVAGTLRRLDPQSLAVHLDALYRAAWALCGSREDAEDLVQETFVRVLARPRLIRGDERGYLMRALRNTFVSRHRSAARRPRSAGTLDDADSVQARPDRQPEHAAEVRELLAAVAQLPPDFRLALVAVDILGLSYREAGRALGAREATITSRVYRARQRVIAALDPPVPSPLAMEEGR